VSIHQSILRHPIDPSKFFFEFFLIFLHHKQSVLDITQCGCASCGRSHRRRAAHGCRLVRVLFDRLHGRLLSMHGGGRLRDLIICVVVEAVRCLVNIVSSFFVDHHIVAIHSTACVVGGLAVTMDRVLIVRLVLRVLSLVHRLLHGWLVLLNAVLRHVVALLPLIWCLLNGHLFLSTLDVCECVAHPRLIRSRVRSLLHRSGCGVILEILPWGLISIHVLR
jgi:hypothetical protein